VPLSKGPILLRVFLGILVLYLIAPLIAGVFRDGDRRGPKIFWIEHHQLLFTLAYEFVYDEKPRPPAAERAWFYGLEGKPDMRYETRQAVRRFFDEVDEGALLTFRQSLWRDGNARFPVSIARSAWPQSFTTNGVLEVRTEKYGVYIVLKHGPDHEGGIVVLGNEKIKVAVEKGLIPNLSRCKYWESGIYRFYRGWKN
jgi:hypothetical protein